MLMLRVAQLILLLLMLFPALFVRKLRVMMLSIVSLNKTAVSSRLEVFLGADILTWSLVYVDLQNVFSYQQ